MFGAVNQCRTLVQHSEKQEKHLPSLRQLLLQTLKFSEKIKGADLIITGEGRTDRQSLMGKVPSGILEEAKRQGIPVIVVAGSIEDTEIMNQAGFQGLFSIIPSPMSLETAMKPEVAKKNICRTVAQIISLVNL